MKLYQVEAVILRSKIMREADKMLTVFSRERGKQRLVAYGAGKSSSRKRGIVQLLCHSQLLLNKGKVLDSVNQCELITVFSQLRYDLDKLMLSFYLCELMEAITVEDEPNEPLFILLLTTLRWLDQVSIDLPAAEKLVTGFEIKMLGLTGYLPELGCCVECGGEINGRLKFSFRCGGVLCANCFDIDAKAMLIKPQSLNLMRQMITSNPGGLPKLQMASGNFNEAKIILRLFTSYHLEQRAKSLDFMQVLNTMEKPGVY